MLNDENIISKSRSIIDLRNVNQVLLGEGVETDFEYNADRFRKNTILMNHI